MEFARHTYKQLRKLPKEDSLRIIYALLEYKKNPRGYIKWLEGRPGYRIRIGKYRVIFEFKDEKIIVLNILRTKEA